MRFSQKIGKTSVRNSIQIESIDNKLENRLWNTIQIYFFDVIGFSSKNKIYKDSDLGRILQDIWQNFSGIVRMKFLKMLFRKFLLILLWYI
jgi:hypothetical protein